MKTLNFGGEEIDVTEVKGDMVGVFSSKEPVDVIQAFSEKYGLEIHSFESQGAIILARKPE